MGYILTIPSSGFAIIVHFLCNIFQLCTIRWINYYYFLLQECTFNVKHQCDVLWLLSKKYILNKTRILTYNFRHCS